MKQLLTLLVFAFCCTTLVVSCKEHKHANDETHEHHAADKADMAMNEVFQCP